jgi:hypothetical protein
MGFGLHIVQQGDFDGHIAHVRHEAAVYSILTKNCTIVLGQQ